jgi:carboxypeptidase Taq
MNKIQKLRAQLQYITKFGSALELLGWDEEVNLPPKAHEYRGEVNATLSAEVHKRFISDEFYQLVLDLAKPENYEKLSDDEKVIVRETKRDVEQSRKIPTDFVEEMAKLTTKAFGSWVEARKKSDFKIFEPVLSEIVRMKQKESEYLGYKDLAYDALLDEFEPGMTVEQLDALFTPLAEKLSVLIEKSQSKPDLPKHNYPIEKQKQLNDKVVKNLGYDLEAGRIDASPHPFTLGIHPTDVRITTRYDEKDFWVSLGSVIHEVGHALYEQGLPALEHGTPLGEAVSLGIHESQSRTWENFVGRSRQFSEYLHPLLGEYFGKLEFTADELYGWLNRVRQNPIRVESDEVTYNLHIVLRYELEKQLMSGELKVSDLPAAWNEKIKQLLGLEISDDAQGVLQDVHWSHATLGYFPTYTLGNLYAAQFFNKASLDNPKLTEDFAKGKFDRLLNWQRKNIHSQGRRYNPAELVEMVTGEKPNSNYLIKHLEQKLEI